MSWDKIKERYFISQFKFFLSSLKITCKEQVKFLSRVNRFVFHSSDARNMARDVHETLEKIITECGNMDKEKATNYVKQMQNKGRYSCDVWSWRRQICVVDKCFEYMYWYM